MTYDDYCVLIPQDITLDDIGNEIYADRYRQILCNINTSGRSEFYQASAVGLDAEKVITVKAYEYEGERLIRCGGKTYSVIRAYSKDKEEVQLTCQAAV